MGNFPSAHSFLAIHREDTNIDNRNFEEILAEMNVTPDEVGEYVDLLLGEALLLAPSPDLAPPKKIATLKAGDSCPSCKLGKIRYAGNKKGLCSHCKKVFDIE